MISRKIDYELNIPEVKCFDYIRRKRQILTYFGKWRFLATIKHKKYECFQSFVFDPKFDFEQKMLTIRSLHDKIDLSNAFRWFMEEYSISREANIVGMLRRRRLMCRYFGKWLSRYQDGLSEFIRLKNLESTIGKNKRMPDILRQLHEQIALQADLSTQIDIKDQELIDIEAIIRDTKQKVVNFQNKIINAKGEQKRICSLKDSVENDYKDRIAALKMQICQCNENLQTQIQQARTTLKQKQEANDATTESIYETKEELSSKTYDLKSKLQEFYHTAISLRDELVECNMDQEQTTHEIVLMRRQVEVLNNDVARLKGTASVHEDRTNSNINSLKEVFAQVQNKQNDINQMIEENKNTIQKQNDVIIQLKRLLDESRKRAELINGAFHEEEDI